MSVPPVSGGSKRALTPIQERGLDLLKRGAVAELGRGQAYLVRSDSAPGEQHLVLCASKDGAPASCSCKGFAFRRDRCAHLCAVQAHLVLVAKLPREVARASTRAPRSELASQAVPAPQMKEAA